MKSEGSFVVIEHYPVDLVKPVDDAQKVGVRFWKMHIELNKATRDSSSIEYTPQYLVETMKNFGFEVSHWKELATTYLEEYSESLSHIIKNVHKIPDEKLRKKFPHSLFLMRFE